MTASEPPDMYTELAGDSGCDVSFTWSLCGCPELSDDLLVVSVGVDAVTIVSDTSQVLCDVTAGAYDELTRPANAFFCKTDGIMCCVVLQADLPNAFVANLSNFDVVSAGILSVTTV